MTPPITIFSDFASPYSYLAERSLRSLGADAVVTYRAARAVAAQVADDWSSLVAAAAVDGIELRAPSTLSATGKAHEAALFARAAGRENLLREAIFRACWTDGADIGRIDVLTGLAADCGLEPEELKIALDIDSHTEAVEADMLVAQRLGIRQTPVTYFGTGRNAKVVAGAYTSTQLRTLLESGDLFQAGFNG